MDQGSINGAAPLVRAARLAGGTYQYGLRLPGADCPRECPTLLEEDCKLSDEKRTISVPVEVSDNFLSELLVTAFDGHYGACWYWCEHVNTDVIGRGQRLAQGDHEDIWVSVTVDDTMNVDEAGNGSRYKVDYDILMRGLRHVMENPDVGDKLRDFVQTALREGDTGLLDAGLADRIVQLGLFAAVPY